MILKFHTPALGFRQAVQRRDDALRRMNDSVHDLRECQNRAAGYLRAPRPRVVVVVDDHEGDRARVVTWLKAADYDVLEAVDAADLRRTLRHVPDVGLVILDLMLPDGDGWLLAEEIQRPIQVIFISGVVDASLDRMARRAGAVGALRKPPVQEDLLAAVERAFRPSLPPVVP